MRTASYAIAFAVGIWAALSLLPLAVIAGTGGVWGNVTNVDLAQNLTSHLIFQRPGWHWPLFYTPDIFWPRGASIAMTDSNPLVSLLAKLIAGLRGHPANLLGFWLGVCWLLQPVAGVYAIRGLGVRRWETAAAGALFAVLFPAFLIRAGHINLCGQFTILLALGRAARMTTRGTGSHLGDWLTAFAILLVAMAIHPMLFLMSAAVLAAPVLQAIIERRPERWRIVVNFLAGVAVVVLLFQVSSGVTGGMDRGFGVYSMNLLSPVWPARSGLFGPTLMTPDATGGQYEGYNYLGAGGLVVIAAALVVLWRTGWPRLGQWRGLAIVLAALTLLALSTQVYAGNILILPLGTRKWDSLFGIVRASGRLFWPVGYMLILGSVAIVLARLRRRSGIAIVAAAALLQFLDTEPLRASARFYFEGDRPATAHVDLPHGVQLLTVLPVCTHSDRAESIAASARLEAAQMGARLSDIKLSRLPGWFNCERVLTDGLELPLKAGEVRLLVEPEATEHLRLTALGSGAACRRYDQSVICTKDLALNHGDVFETSADLPSLAFGTVLSGDAMLPVLSFGWEGDPKGGAFWSEGPRATLLARVPNLPANGAELKITLSGIAHNAGGQRPISYQVGAGPVVALTLGDLKSTEIKIPVSAADISDGLLRLAFDIDHPVDPTRRELSAPVNRAGLRIEKLALTAVP
jgi:hypothetical protein